MAIKSRLKRLETALASNGEPARRSFDDHLAALAADSATVEAWLAQHGYDNCLEAVAAGESGPELLTVGWTLATFGELERDTIEEAIHAGIAPGVSLWFHLHRGWCVPLDERLVYLGADLDSAVARIRSLSTQGQGTG